MRSQRAYTQYCPAGAAKTASPLASVVSVTGSRPLAWSLARTTVLKSTNASSPHASRRRRTASGLLDRGLLKPVKLGEGGVSLPLHSAQSRLFVLKFPEQDAVLRFRPVERLESVADVLKLLPEQRPLAIEALPLRLRFSHPGLRFQKRVRDGWLGRRRDVGERVEDDVPIIREEPDLQIGQLSPDCSLAVRVRHLEAPPSQPTRPDRTPSLRASPGLRTGMFRSSSVRSDPSRFKIFAGAKYHAVRASSRTPGALRGGAVGGAFIVLSPRRTGSLPAALGSARARTRAHAALPAWKLRAEADLAIEGLYPARTSRSEPDRCASSSILRASSSGVASRIAVADRKLRRWPIEEVLRHDGRSKTLRGVHDPSLPGRSGFSTRWWRRPERPVRPEDLVPRRSGERAREEVDRG